MNKELGKRWVDALRSGKYKQGFTQLRTHQINDEPGVFSYCCLGVVVNEHIVPAVTDEENVRSYDDQLQLCGTLRPYQLEALGITKEQQDDLIRLNDRHFPFSYIADYIEQELMNAKEDLAGAQESSEQAGQA